MRIETLDRVQLPALSVGIMADVLRDDPANRSVMLRSAGIDPARRLELDVRIPAAQELECQRAFAAMTWKRPDLWAVAGHKYRFLSYGAYGLAVLTSSTLWDAMRAALQDDLSYSLAHYRMIMQDGALVGISCDAAEVPEELRLFTACRDASTIHALFGELWNGEFPFTGVELALPAAVGGAVGQMFACPVSYDCETTAFRWSPEASRRPLRSGDLLLNEYYTRVWRRRMPVTTPGDGLLAQVADALTRIDLSAASLLSVALYLGVSERNLQRHLQERNVTFREILDQARHHKAVEMVRHSRMQVSEIAYRLGYAEAASFSHAFKRWTGSSPRQFREDLDEGAGDGADPAAGADAWADRHGPAVGGAIVPPREVAGTG
ncbi:MAG: helix-turn-helix transcriptional regulator [Rhodobacteraceae bacterium]|jgi:AraC-like DNA-binding protein|nr:helix-turn-helix transcriptional regulator [Paracoccaceae bacterium]